MPDAIPLPDSQPPPAPGAPEVGWLRGQLHAHTAASGDSQTPIGEVARWYGEHGYDFVVITDHNRVTELPASSPVLLIPGIELTYNPAACEPPPPEPEGACRIHMNGLFVSAPDAAARPWKEVASRRRVDMYQAELDQVRALGAVAQLNHPTWHRGVDAALLTELAGRGVLLVEIANQGFARWNLGTDRYPSAEAVWDGALSAGATLYGVASDDAHHYYDVDKARASGGPVYPAGRGFVMVRAARDPAAIRAALLRGDFYASTGVLLDRVDESGGRLTIEVAAASAGAHRISFIGAGGAPLREVEGRSASFELAGAAGGYVRAVVRGPQGSAWTQPVRAPPDSRRAVR